MASNLFYFCHILGNNWSIFNFLDLFWMGWDLTEPTWVHTLWRFWCINIIYHGSGYNNHSLLCIPLHLVKFGLPSITLVVTVAVQVLYKSFDFFRHIICFYDYRLFQWSGNRFTFVLGYLLWNIWHLRQLWHAYSTWTFIAFNIYRNIYILVEI